jgi:hypothetical protein
MFFFLLFFLLSTAHENYTHGKQGQDIKSGDDECHSYLRRFLSNHIPQKMQSPLRETDPRIKPQVSAWKVIHSSNGKNTTINTPISRKTSPNISSFDRFFESFSDMISRSPSMRKLP